MNDSRPKFRIVDLFCGMGGLTIGASQACKELGIELEIALANDLNPDCALFYKRNFKNELNIYFDGDIKTLNTEFSEGNLLLGEIDVLFAGPPCQGHSNLNNQTRRNDPRNSLYFETIEFIVNSLPKYFLIENVPSVVHSHENVVDLSLDRLSKAGYSVTDYVVEFKSLGVAQLRKRHIMIGEYKSSSLKRSFLSDVSSRYSQKSLKDVIGDLMDVESTDLFDTPSMMKPENRQRADYLISNNLYDLPNEFRPLCHQKEHSYKSMYGRLNWDKPSQTITGGFGSMGQGRFIHPEQARVITPHEAARIQGIPDGLDFSSVQKRTSLHQMIANAVPPVLSKEFLIEVNKDVNYGHGNKRKKQF
jgi:DNA (cytosine-5)-methyltransferase 1